MNGEERPEIDRNQLLNDKYSFMQGMVAGFLIGLKFDEAGENAFQEFGAGERADTIGEIVKGELIKLVGKEPVPGFPVGIPSDVMDAADSVCLSLVYGNVKV
jgi:hypothetical protein